MAHYLHPAIRQLKDQQVKYAPREVRLEQMRRAEYLLAELDPDEQYYYRDLCEQVTKYKAELYPDLILSGREALHDLRRFIEDLSESVGLSAGQIAEPVLTVAEVRERFRVSTKTISRWRNQGLASRRFRVGKKLCVGFLESVVSRFAALHAEHVERSGRFRQVSLAEREAILRRARRLARHGANLAEISRRLARRFGRSPETIRSTIHRHDRRHPESAVFAQWRPTLTDEQRKDLARAVRRGTPAARLAEQHGLTRSSVYRIANEVRARSLRNQLIEWVDNDDFRNPALRDEILGPPPAGDEPAPHAEPPAGLPPYLATLYGIPVLTREQEVHAFRKMNYLKHEAARIQKGLNVARPVVKDLDRIEELLRASQEVKNGLIRANLRLVVSIARRHLRPGANFFEVVSDGNMALIQAIERFDYSRGNKFSTFATWVVMKNFARSIPEEDSQLDRFRTGRDEVLRASSDPRTDELQLELATRRQHQALMSILDQLDPRERDIIVYRYGLGTVGGSETREQVGKRLGVSRERIRQIESRALEKLRRLAMDERLELPDV